MIYDNHSIENRIIYASDLAIIGLIISELKTEGMDIIVLGDFNTDFDRNCEYTNMLEEFLNKNNLIPADRLNQQLVNYTYKSKSKSSWIDHVICDSNNSNIQNINIIENLQNRSDHNPITLETPRISEITAGLNKLETMILKFRNETSKDKIKLQATALINEISSHLINATIKTKNEFMNKKRKKRRIGDLKYKIWWDKIIQEIHNKLIDKYIAYRKSSFAYEPGKEYKEAKREFRLRKRLNIKLKRNKSLRTLDHLLRLDKDMFWKKVRQLSSKKNTVDI
ncbi:hypothetical protein BpHYR1_011145 [Brachionus plicatilis]|uniref:Endonuclease/exonuclease/phosphatase domain-containing protein n=1 Tax=Brachionus plicatilis TaxID=10195 RepID=A0A3M7QT39_BRAPC|nr:hypothetical protein BpHYR1_011145 [Brachionus plicatilis]